MTTAGHIFAYQVTDRPGVWLRVIAPADDIESLQAALQQQFRGRLLAVRNEADPAAVIAVHGDASCAGPVAAPVVESPGQRHRWEKLEVHRYRCRLCGIERRNWVDPDTWQWFATFAAPGERPNRSTHTPPCAGDVRQ